MTRPKKTLGDIQSTVCNTTLVWLASLALPAIMFSFLRIVEVGWQPVMAIHAAVVALLIPITIFRNQLPLGVRGSTIVLLMFVNACGGLMTFGSPAGLPYFIGSSVMAAVLFGRRWGILTVASALAATSMIYMGFRYGVFVVRDPAIQMAATSWLANASGIIITAVGPIVAISKLNEQLLAEREFSDAANAAKSSFLATMSHELRTPMTGILGISELMMYEPLPSATLENVKRIHASGRQLLNLLNNILDFSRIEREEFPIESVPFRLREIVDEMNALFLPLAIKKGLQLHLQFDSNIPDVFVGDPTRLRQVTHNLVGNAVKFTEQGSVRVNISVEPLSAGNVRLHVAVSDTGIGLSPAQQKVVFLPFVQGDGTITRRFGGSGLGLAISRRLVETLGGAIQVSSQEGLGSTFSFTVPLREGTLARDAGEAESSIKHAEPARHLRILMAEDNETLRDLIYFALRRRGHAVDCVGDGREALAAAQQNHYDAILMDVHMPDMDGIECTKRIRALALDNSVVPIIAVTADIVLGRRDTYLQAGFSDVVEKPIDWNVLFQKLEGRWDAEVGSRFSMGPAPSEPGARGAAWGPLDEAALGELADAIGPNSLSALLSEFGPNTQELLVALADAVAKKDVYKAKQVAHALTGVLHQFGAIRAGEIAEKIQATAITIEEIAGIELELNIAMRSVQEAMALRVAESKGGIKQ